MPNRKKWPVIAGAGFVLLVIVLIALTTFGNNTYRCEVCVMFGGRTLCRNGAATTQEEAQRIAIDSACTDLSAGMNQFIQCKSSAPTKTTWKR